MLGSTTAHLKPKLCLLPPAGLSRVRVAPGELSCLGAFLLMLGNVFRLRARTLLMPGR